MTVEIPVLGTAGRGRVRGQQRGKPAWVLVHRDSPGITTLLDLPVAEPSFGHTKVLVIGERPGKPEGHYRLFTGIGSCLVA